MKKILTKREQEIFDLLAKNKTTNEIAIEIAKDIPIPVMQSNNQLD